MFRVRVAYKTLPPSPSHLLTRPFFYHHHPDSFSSLHFITHRLSSSCLLQKQSASTWVQLTRKSKYAYINRNISPKLTLFRCVGVWQNDRVEIIANDQGNRTTPSYVAFSDTERLIGDAAKNQVAMNPRNTVFDAKRLIGRKFADAEVQSDLKHFPFTVVDRGGKPVIQVEYRGETKEFVSGPHTVLARHCSLN